MTPEIKSRIDQIRRGEVPEGYKRTRKGIIPNGWSIHPIRDFAVISSGSTPNRGNPAYWNGDIPWVTTGELEGGYIAKTSECITTQALSETSLRVYPVGTLLMAMYGQGKTRGTVAKLGIEAAVNQACAAILLKSGDADFVFCALQNAYVVMHEFCHFIHPNHSKQFYAFLAMLMPDWKQRKEILDKSTAFWL